MSDANQIEQQIQRQQQLQIHQTNQPSRSHCIQLATPKNMTQPAYGTNYDKNVAAKCEFNKSHQKCDVTTNIITTTATQYFPLNNRTVIDAANRTASGLIMEKEIFKCKNTKYSQVISNKDDTISIPPNINHSSNDDIHAVNVNQTTTFSEKAMQMPSISGKKPMTAKNVNLLKQYQRDASNRLISRVSEELNAAPVEKFHSSLDLGESLFIQKFLELEISI